MLLPHDIPMTTDRTYKLTDVFGTSREVPLTYVQRPGVDDRFLNDITRDKHLVIHGSSKQGKTCLRKYHLKQSDYVLLQCTRESSKASVYEMLLKHAGVKCEVSRAETVRGTLKLRARLSAEGDSSFLPKHLQKVASSTRAKSKIPQGLATLTSIPTTQMTSFES